MLKNFTFLTLFLSLIYSCKTAAPRELTMADLQPVVKYYAINNAEAPKRPMYTMALYNDSRLELQAYSGLDKIGAYTTMLNTTEYNRLTSLLKKTGEGHIIHHHPTESISYDITYLPLKKDPSMGNGKVLKEQTQSVLINSEFDDFIKFKNWIKKQDAPSIFGENIANELIVSGKLYADLKNDILALSDKYGLKIIKNLDKINNTWLVSYSKGSLPEVIQALRRNDNIVGAVENKKLNIEKNRSIFGDQELIIQCTETINLEEWVKTYAAQKMRAVKQVAPNLNYYVVAFDESVISSKDLINLLKKDSKIKEAQLNKKVMPRE